MAHLLDVAYMFDWLHRKLGRRYPLVYLAFDFMSTVSICAGTVALFSLYEDMSGWEFLKLLAAAEVASLVGIVIAAIGAKRCGRPAFDWIRGRRKGPEFAREAWLSAVSFPREFVSQNGWKPFAVVSIPVAVYFPLELDLPWISGVIVFAGALVAIAYSAVLHFFGIELFMRPVVREITTHLPADFAGAPVGVPLKYKLLLAVPIINVVTGVVVSGLSTSGPSSIEDLGLDVIVAVLIAFTVSFELTLLIVRSVVAPVKELVRASDAVGRGDLTVRVPPVSGDEMGELAAGFNHMVSGLDERQRLREAFGTYVDPDIAERVLNEGELLEGVEMEASLMFVDVRDFTEYAENATAREAVDRLNDFFGLVVPVVLKHGGHANKFIGDGMLAVFGAPDRRPDHADRAVAAGCEIASVVSDEYGDELRIGVGINSGPVVVGTVGGGGRLEFSVIGDPVNVAARVEKATRETGDTVLVTGATRALLTRPDEMELDERDSLMIRGKTAPIPVYAPKRLPVAPAREADRVPAVSVLAERAARLTRRRRAAAERAAR